MEMNGSEFQILVRANRRLAFYVKALIAIWAFTFAAFAWLSGGKSGLSGKSAQGDVLTARGLIIVDAHGKTRIRIGAPLPEPVIMGKEGKRDDSISGILIYDALGNERGGYVTDNSVGNALLSLDSATGQEVTLVAYPGGGADFMINDDQKNKVILSASETGPRIRLMQRGDLAADLPVPSKSPRTK